MADAIAEGSQLDVGEAGRQNTPDQQCFLDHLAYQDAVPAAESELLEWYAASESAQRYAAELRLAIEKYGEQAVVALANASVGNLHAMLGDLGINTQDASPYSRSSSWALWHLAKERSLATQPDVQAKMANADKYDPHDPFLVLDPTMPMEDRVAAARAIKGMEYGHLGWELYRLTSPKLDRGPQQPNVPYDIRAMIQPGAPVTLDVGKLVEEEPKRQPGVDTTLSTYKLQFLGEQTYTHRRRPPTEYPS
jgi:hypothetical protein